MADVTPKSEGRKGARKHSGLGRGLGALIPQAGEQTPQATPTVPSRPLDVFFPEGPAARGRGGFREGSSSTETGHGLVKTQATRNACTGSLQRADSGGVQLARNRVRRGNCRQYSCRCIGEPRLLI